MLIYERKMKGMIPEILDKNFQPLENDIILSSKECELNSVFPQNNQRIIWKGKNDESYLMHKFYEIQEKVPPSIIEVNFI